MHPLGLYLAITDGQREHGWMADEDRRLAPSSVDRLPTAAPRSPSRIARLATLLRRRVLRAAGA